MPRCACPFAPLLEDSRRGAKRSEEHTSELQSRLHLVCRLLLEKKKNKRGRRKTPTGSSPTLHTPPPNTCDLRCPNRSALTCASRSTTRAQRSSLSAQPSPTRAP